MVAFDLGLQTTGEPLIEADQPAVTGAEVLPPCTGVCADLDVRLTVLEGSELSAL